jgi:hypothetical protein
MKRLCCLLNFGSLTSAAASTTEPIYFSYSKAADVLLKVEARHLMVIPSAIQLLRIANPGFC